ncbi:hypothetical protein EV426DRAFT_162934 [Tirmania nivea]|nr:hypothetical protein EV426DRAFT_162934 [Tirmania nivea]
MLGASTAALSHPLPQPSEPVSSSGKDGAFFFSTQPSQALSVDSSGSSTIRGTPEGRKLNRWSGSASSLSRSNSDSSTLSKVRSSHAHSVSVPHIVTTRPGGSSQESRTKPSPSPAIESSNAGVNDDKTSIATQHIPPPPIQPSRPPSPPSRPKAQHRQLSVPRKTRQHRSSSQRAMLFSALQKANTAVLLDNAGNIEGAMEAYRDACTLLQQAMSRAELEGDRAQLQSIHDTYVNRIDQLRAMVPRSGCSEKELPARPLTQEFIDEVDSIREEDEQQYDEDQYYIEEEELNMYQTESLNTTATQQRYPRKAVVPPRRDSLSTGASHSESKHYRNDMPPPLPLKVSSSRLNPPSPIAESFGGDDIFERITESRQSTDKESLRFSISRDQLRRSTSTGSASSRVSSQRHSSTHGHSRGGSEVSTSWLNTIDESGGSVSGDSIEGGEWGRRAGFDAELDAAVEAAYDDDDEFGLGAYEDDGVLVMKSPDELASGSSDKGPGTDLERAKERVRRVEREMRFEIEQNEERRKRLRERIMGTDMGFYDNGEEEGEMLLEDATREYSLNDFEFDLKSKTLLPRDPRESSSSSISASTWVSSVASKKSSFMSHGYTSGTALQSVAELPPSRPPSVPPPPPPLSALASPPQLQLKPSLENISNLPLVASTPPPTSPPRTLPPPPPPGPSGSSSKGLHSPSSLNAMGPGVRMRRLSGLAAGPLKIETASPALAITTQDIPESSIASDLSSLAPTDPPAPLPQLPNATDEEVIQEVLNALRPTASSPTPSLMTQDPPPPVPLKTIGTVRPFPASPLPGTENAGFSLMPHPLYGLSQEALTPRPGSPARFASKMANLPGLRQINSSSSLKNLNKVSTPEMEATSPITPGLGGFFGSTGSATNLRLIKTLQTQMTTPPTPSGMVPMTLGYAFSPSALGLASGGLSLFDSKLHSPTTPGSPSSLIPNPPVPLEPCPTEPLSRPFWLMRCLYQTIAHTRGGYISARLFVPKDVWLQKGVKIKAVDDKISACDLVSAALAKLTIIQSGGPDLNAIYEEMQSLEGVLDRVQAMLSKKLGNEVGAAGATALYGSGLNGDSGGVESGKASVGKSYLSWRKLRSKNSNTSLASSFAPEPGFDTPSLPMATPRTGSDSQKPPERNLKSISFTGPNSAYIAALARVFDAAQALDRLPIDLGKLPRKAQVGLELSQRHAAEFFGLYICRFVLADVTILLDKFLKKGTEWVGS